MSYQAAGTTNATGGLAVSGNSGAPGPGLLRVLQMHAAEVGLEFEPALSVMTSKSLALRFAILIDPFIARGFDPAGEGGELRLEPDHDVDVFREVGYRVRFYDDTQSFRSTARIVEWKERWGPTFKISRALGLDEMYPDALLEFDYAHLCLFALIAEGQGRPDGDRTDDEVLESMGATVRAAFA